MYAGFKNKSKLIKLSLLMMIDIDNKNDNVVVQLTCLTYLDFISVLFDGHQSIACAHILLCFAILCC